MRSSEPWRASALMAALLLVGAAGAQPPGQKREPPRGRVQPAPGVDDIVERIMAFDKNKDGKVTKDELPERMHHLIARGDTNKDGALDKDEIRKLATKLAGTPGGFGVGTFRSVRFDDDGGPIRGIVEDLKLSGKKKDQALAVVKAHQESVRKLMDQARADMLREMKKVLSEEEFKDFKAALDRPVRRFAVGPAGPPPPALDPAGAPTPRELERRLDRLQKEVEELRRSRRR
jgi:EF hand domain-containing protein